MGYFSDAGAPRSIAHWLQFFEARQPGDKVIVPPTAAVAEACAAEGSSAMEWCFRKHQL